MDPPWKCPWGSTVVEDEKDRSLWSTAIRKGLSMWALKKNSLTMKVKLACMVLKSSTKKVLKILQSRPVLDSYTLQNSQRPHRLTGRCSEALQTLTQPPKHSSSHPPNKTRWRAAHGGIGSLIPLSQRRCWLHKSYLWLKREPGNLHGWHHTAFCSVLSTWRAFPAIVTYWGRIYLMWSFLNVSSSFIRLYISHYFKLTF